MKKTLLFIALLALVIISGGCLHPYTLPKEARVDGAIHHLKSPPRIGIDPRKQAEEDGAFIKQYGVDKTQAMLEKQIRKEKVRMEKSRQAMEKARQDYESAKRYLDYREELLQILLEWRKKEGI